MELTVVIPCFNSGSSLIDLVSDLVDEASALFKSFEIVLVVDSPNAGTHVLTGDLEARFPQVTRILLSKNFGQQAATAAGIIHSSGDIIITMDDDYQHSPTDAMVLAARLQQDAQIDLVYGVPRTQKQSLSRRITSRLFRKLMVLSGLKHFDLFSPFRAFRGQFRPAIAQSSGPNFALDIVLGWIVQEVQGQTCDFRSRLSGKSGYSTSARIRLAMRFLMAHSVMPLRIGIYIGGLGAAVAGALGMYILVAYFLGSVTVPGFATTSLAILFIGSIQLLLLGIVGQYLGKQYQASLGKPLYYIKEMVS